jgi:hypothetical protein
MCFEEIRSLLEKAEYENHSKKRKRDFIRKRKMTFKTLMLFMLSIVKESSQNASNSKYHPSGSSPQTKRIKASRFSCGNRQKVYVSAIWKLSRPPARSRALR